MARTESGTLTETDTQTCNNHDCPTTTTSTIPTQVDGNWGLWSHWSTCSASCGEGRISRIRTCDNPFPQYGGSSCHWNGSFVEVTDVNGGVKEISSLHCLIKHCPVHCQWGDWMISDCTVTCGGGTRTKSRTPNVSP